MPQLHTHHEGISKARQTKMIELHRGLHLLYSHPETFPTAFFILCTRPEGYSTIYMVLVRPGLQLNLDTTALMVDALTAKSPPWLLTLTSSDKNPKIKSYRFAATF